MGITSPIYPKNEYGYEGVQLTLNACRMEQDRIRERELRQRAANGDKQAIMQLADEYMYSKYRKDDDDGQCTT